MKPCAGRGRQPILTPIPVIDDGAPLKPVDAGAVGGGGDGAIPVIDDGAPLKRAHICRDPADSARSPSSMTGPR